MARSSLDQLSEAASRLDPGSRALLDLSLARDLDDREIAELIGTGEDTVRARRTALLEQVAGELDAPVDHVREGLRRLLRMQAGEAPGAAASNGPPPPHRDTPRDQSPATSAQGGGRETASFRRRRAVALVLVAAVAVAALVAVLLLTRDSGDGGSTPPARSSAPAASAATALTFQRFPAEGGGASASGSLAAGGRLRLRIAGLRRRSYVLWLFNSLVDSRPVAALRGPKATVDVRLPAIRTRYQFLDLSLEPSDGNRSHSGRSVLRTELPR